jgi:hypothetical protein
MFKSFKISPARLLRELYFVLFFFPRHCVVGRVSNLYQSINPFQIQADPDKGGKISFTNQWI